MEKKKVVVGMSGGVDSSVAAWLLQKQGYEVWGVTMQIWQDEDPDQVEENGGCCGLSAVDDARRVASRLEIPYYVMNFKQDFKERVIDYFMDEYLKGRTPNPCIACNRYVKWESLLKRSLDIGADYIATGHYAQIEHLPNGRYAIKNSATAAKDQTYALYNLTQEQLSHTLMPVGAYTKDQIRAFAEEAGLPGLISRTARRFVLYRTGTMLILLKKIPAERFRKVTLCGKMAESSESIKESLITPSASEKDLDWPWDGR